MVRQFDRKLRMYCAAGSAAATMLAVAGHSQGQVFQGSFSHDLGGNDSGSIDPTDAYGQSFFDTGDDTIDSTHQLGTDGNNHTGAHLYLTNKFSSYKGSYLYTGNAGSGAVANLPVGSIIGPGTLPSGTAFENSLNGTDNDIAYTDSTTGTVFTPQVNSGSTPTQFSVLTTGYYGFSIQPNGGTQTDYGYAAITFDSSGDVSGTFAYNTTGGAITVAPFPVSAWAASGSGDYANASNWITGVPNGVGFEADFGNFANNSGGATVNVGSSVVLSTVRFFNKTVDYTLSGSGSLTLNSSTGSALLVNEQGSHTISIPVTFVSSGALDILAGSSTAINTLNINAPLTFNNGGSIHVGTAGSLAVTGTTTLTAGNLSVTTDAFYGAVTGTVSLATVNIAGGSNVTFDYNYQAGLGVIPISSLILGPSSSATLTAYADGAGNIGKLALQLGGLSLTPTSKIDLQSNDLIIQGNTSLATITTAVGDGYNGGKWNGSGIASSTAAADTTHLTAIGVIENSTDGTTALYGGGLGSFDGLNPNPTDILLRYTYYGDANLDGQVDGSDYSLIDNGFLNHLSGWYNGDFNYDGVVDGSDYTLIDNAFNQQQGNLVANPAGPAVSIATQIGGTAVPEPASLTILAMGTTALLRRKR
jgi:hypothetical protein